MRQTVKTANSGYPGDTVREGVLEQVLEPSGEPFPGAGNAKFSPFSKPRPGVPRGPDGRITPSREGVWGG